MTRDQSVKGQLFELYVRLSRLAAAEKDGSGTAAAWLGHAERLALTPGQRLRVLLPKLATNFYTYDDQQVALRREAADLALLVDDPTSHISVISISVLSAVRADRPFEEIAEWLDLARRLPFSPSGHTYSNVVVGAAAELNAGGAPDLAWQLLKQALRNTIDRLP